MDQSMGQIMLWAGNFAPKGWALCNGQLLSIQQNQALFSILGVYYGGDGVNTFALPDLRGRIATHAGASAGPGLTQVVLGERYGTNNITLNQTNLPEHMHLPIGTTTVAIAATSSDDEDSPNPVGAYLKTTPNVSTYAGTSNAVMGSVNATVTVQNAGSNLPVNNVSPTLTLNFCIALQGIYPSRG